MWKKVIGLASVLAAIVLIAGCQATAPQASVETYSNARFGFSVNYPDGWEVEEEAILEESMGAGFFTEAFFTKDIFLHIIAWDFRASGFSSLEHFYNRGIMERYRNLEGFCLLEEQYTPIDKVVATEATFTYTEADCVVKNTITAFLDTRYTTPLDSNAFAIAYEAPIDFYGDYYQDFRLVVDTFRFTD